MKKLFSFCFTVFAATTFAQTPDTSTAEKKARYNINRLRENATRAITHEDFRNAFRSLTDLAITRVPYLSMQEVREGKADTARVVQIVDSGREGTFVYDPTNNSADDTVFVIRNRNRRYVRELKGEPINVRLFGVTGDSRHDDTPGIIKALNAAKSREIGLMFPKGVYKASSLTEYIVDKPIRIIGTDAVIDLGGNTLTARKIFKVRADFQLDGLTFQNGGWIIDPSSNPATRAIRMSVRNCVFKNVNAPVQFDNIYSSKTQVGPINVSFTGNIVNNCRFSISLNGITRTESVIITNNDINGISKLGGIRVGEDDPVDRPNQKNIIISDNTIRNILGTGGAQYDGQGNIIGGDANRGTGNAIAVFGTNVSIAGNLIENNTTDSGFDGEAIYGKVNYGVISGNTILNSPAIEGAINFKTSKRLIISHNVVSNCYRGVHVAAAEELIISNNSFELIRDAGIHVAQRGQKANGENRSFNICNNLIGNSPNAQCGIRLRGWGGDVNINGNVITDIGRYFNTPGSGVGSGILVDAGDDTELNPDGSALVATLENVTLMGNTIRNIYAGNGLVDSTYKGNGVYLRVRDGSITLRNVVVTSNTISNVYNGVALGANGTKLSDVNVIANMITGEVANKIYSNSADVSAGRIENVNVLNFRNGLVDRTWGVSGAIESVTTGGNYALQVKRSGTTNKLALVSPSGTGQVVKMMVTDAANSEVTAAAIATQSQSGVTAGNVGIGTLTPSQKLHVAGSVLAAQFRLSALNTAPTSSTAPGTAGEIRITADYIYVCIAANQWVRSPLSTW